MLSDEEKKSVDKIKTLIQYLNVWKENFTIVPEDVKYLVTILNLIEKQSKEIEELKEKNEYLPNWVSKKYVSKDKIKAKIEELEKLDFGTDLVSQFTANLTTITILQSLLEKE